MKNKKWIIALTILSLVTSAVGCQGNNSTAAEKGSSATDSITSDKTAVPDADDGSTAAVAEGETVDRFAGDFDVTNDAKSVTADKAEKMTELAEAAEFDKAMTTAEPGDIALPNPGQDIPEQKPEAGLLTAGEWRDNDNWGFFTNLVNTDKITFPSYGIDPRYRLKITVKNDAGEPVPNATAKLFDEKTHQKIWSSVSDHSGVAYLFAEPDTETVSITVTNGENSEIIEPFSLKKQSADNQRTAATVSEELNVTIGGEKKAFANTEVMFILDTTGSMSDEMLFLQSEFSAITKEIGTERTKYSVNFYRDEGDEYVTKCSDFTDDISDLQQRLNAETADGGGDIPEAVAEILQQTISQGKWSEESVKLAFLIFDAPPHEEKEAILQKAISDAAEKGIRLIPVVSSNSERDTELFARAIAIKTGGTYVFLTDDSGIGDSHLEPIIGDYQVEKLYDIIIRVIKEYQQ